MWKKRNRKEKEKHQIPVDGRTFIWSPNKTILLHSVKFKIKQLKCAPVLLVSVTIGIYCAWLLKIHLSSKFWPLAMHFDSEPARELHLLPELL